MGRTKKLTLSAMVTALCFIPLAASSLLPNLSISLAALAGLFPAAVVLVCGYGWACGAMLASLLLAELLLPVKTATVWFAVFFGHYPLWKAGIEALQGKTGKAWLGWVLKLLGFSACISVLYFFLRSFFFAGLSNDFSDSSLNPMIWVAGLLTVFVVYDYVFSILIGWFRTKVLPRLR